MKTITTTHAIAAAVIALASLSAHAETPTHLLGTSATPEVATRAISVSPATSYINVNYGDVVRFDVNGQSFTIKFDGVRKSFDLNALAPAGVLSRTVKVYVAPVREDDLS